MAIGQGFGLRFRVFVEVVLRLYDALRSSWGSQMIQDWNFVSVV